MEKGRKIILFIIIFYIIYISFFLVKYDFNPSAIIEISENYSNSYSGKLPSNLVIHNSKGFDGQHYYFMALNPNLDNLNINPAFFQRIFYPMITILFSLGIKSLYPLMMLLINFASIILSCCILLLFLRKYNVNTTLAIFFAINVGFLIAILRNLTEPLMTLLVITSIYFLDEKRYILSSIFLTFALLTKELAITIYSAILLFFLLKKDLKKFLIYSLSIIPLFILEIILIIKKNRFPLNESFFSISNPLIGFINYFRNIPLNITRYITEPINNNQLFIHESLTSIYTAFNVFPLLTLILIQLLIIIIIFIKTKKITLHLLLLLSQIALFITLRDGFFSYHQIDGIGRYAILFIFFAIIFYIKERKNFNKFLNFLSLISLLLLILNSTAYVITRIIFFISPFYLS